MRRPIRLPLLDADPASPFPDPALALREPNGLLAFGGDLSPPRLLNAYRHGIFPWFSPGEPILWWSPDPRMVVAPAEVHLPRRLRRTLRGCGWTLRADHAFDEVVERCASVAREGQRGTWISNAMQSAYGQLHRLGYAHSVEVIDAAGTLIGGIYGVAIGRMFFGESMFGLRSGASRTALAGLCYRLAEWGYALLDGQVESDHLARLGFAPMPRAAFLARSTRACAQVGTEGDWREPFGAWPAAGLTKF